MRRPWSSWCLLGNVPLVLLAAAALTSSSGCSKPEDDEDILPPAGWSPTPRLVLSPLGPVHFGNGWYAMESNTHENWRWMGQVGEIRVPTIPAKAHLEIQGWAPVGLLPTPPVIQISFNGRELERFVPPSGRFKKEYDVAEDLQRQGPESVVRLATSATAVPPGDPRALGVALVSVTWVRAP